MALELAPVLFRQRAVQKLQTEVHELLACEAVGLVL
jgi:hypothetical protein